MQLLRAVAAAEALRNLAAREWDYKSAYAIYDLQRRLRPQVDFFTERELALAREYGETDERGELKLDEKRSFKLREGKDLSEYLRRREELGAVEVDADVGEPIVLPLPERIRPAELAALEGFVAFEEVE